jgi:hypothetical protein
VRRLQTCFAGFRLGGEKKKAVVLVTEALIGVANEAGNEIANEASKIGCVCPYRQAQGFSLNSRHDSALLVTYPSFYCIYTVPVKKKLKKTQ